MVSPARGGPVCRGACFGRFNWLLIFLFSLLLHCGLGGGRAGGGAGARWVQSPSSRSASGRRGCSSNNNTGILTNNSISVSLEQRMNCTFIIGSLGIVATPLVGTAGIVRTLPLLFVRSRLHTVLGMRLALTLFAVAAALAPPYEGAGSCNSVSCTYENGKTKIKVNTRYEQEHWHW